MGGDIDIFGAIEYGHDLMNDNSGGAAASASNAESAANAARRTSEKMEDLVARQALVIHTLVAMCEQKGVFTRAELLALMEQIDMLDGKRDGKLAPIRAPRSCPSCGKGSAAKATKCIYCGTEFPYNPLAG